MRQCITIGPGGILGLYMLGTIMYLKNFYNIDQYKIGGSSAGAVVALYALSQESDEYVLKTCIHPLIDTFIDTPKAWRNMPLILSEHLNPIVKNIDTNRAFVSVSIFKESFPFYQGSIIEVFDGNEHLLQTAVASAYVPILCGGFAIECENGEACFDGAVYTNNPIPNDCEQILHITPSIWGRDFSGFEAIQLKSKNNLKNMIVQGFWDAHENKHFLDNLLPNRQLHKQIFNRLKLKKLKQVYSL